METVQLLNPNFKLLLALPLLFSIKTPKTPSHPHHHTSILTSSSSSLSHSTPSHSFLSFFFRPSSQPPSPLNPSLSHLLSPPLSTFNTIPIDAPSFLPTVPEHTLSDPDPDLSLYDTFPPHEVTDIADKPPVSEEKKQERFDYIGTFF